MRADDDEQAFEQGVDATVLRGELRGGGVVCLGVVHVRKGAESVAAISMPI